MVEDERRAREVECDLLAALGAETAPSAAGALVVEAALALTEADGVGLYVADPKGAGLELVVHRGLSPALVQAQGRWAATSSEVATLERGLAIVRGGSETDWLSELEQREGLRSRAVVPLRQGGKLVAALMATSRRDLPATGLSRLEALAARCGGPLARIVAAERLRARAEQLEVVLASATDGFWEWDFSTGAVEWSERCTQLLGPAPAPAPGVQTFATRIHVEDRPEFLDKVSAHLAGRTPRLEATVRMQTPAGSWVWLLCRGKDVGCGPKSEARLAGTLTDVTEAKRLNEKLLHAQRLDSVGRLAGGVAHEFNNLLTTIVGGVELARRSLTGEAPVSESLEEVLRAGHRAAQLTSQLLAFSRRQVIELRVVHPNSLVLNMDKLLRRIIGENIELVTLLGKDVGPIRVDPGRVEQAIVNLAVNARDAMPKGGTLTIETSSVVAGDRGGPGQGGVGEQVIISVSDSGEGMPEEVAQHIFDPFYTTKDTSAGLGLAATYGIIRQHGGEVRVESTVGQGTTFRIYLPCAPERRRAAPRSLEPVAELPNGREVLIVAEDEPAVRRFMVRVLGLLGYQVHPASDGEKALEQLDLLANKVDLLITDVIMPVMGGVDLVERARARLPHLKVLYMSGYAEQGGVQLNALNETTWFLEKPFTIGTLAHKVRDLLDQHPDEQTMAGD